MQQRIRRGISLEEAARATRIRGDRLADLERDDYANFPNLAYAKGFLVIYSKYLGVDVSDFTRSFDTGNPVGVDDYAYLKRPAEKVSVTSGRPKQAASSGSPALVLAGFLGLCVAAVTFMYVWTSAQRIGMIAAPVAAVAVPPPAPSPAAAPVAASTPVAPDPEPVAEAPAASPEPPVFRAEVVVPAEAVAVTTDAHEIILQPVKKTWVVVRQGGPDTAPIFEDYLDPQGPPMRFRGTDFFIQLNDEGGVQIRRNGEPVAYHAPGVTIR